MKLKRNIKIIQIKILYFFLSHFKNMPKQNILIAFSNKFPNSKYPVWHKTKDGSWQVSFNENLHQVIAVFNNDGRWEGSRFFTQFLLLPKSVREAFESQFNKKIIIGVYALKFKKVDLYKFLINENSKTRNLLFSSSGLLLSGTSLKTYGL